jgi:2-iminobutanoate/2-iminopropanoate deaminase
MKRQEYLAPGLPTPIGHYTSVVRWGDLYFLSGVAPADETGQIVGEGDIEVQARQVFENWKKQLDAIGATFADVLTMKLYVTEMDADRLVIDAVRREYFGDTRPTSTLVQVSRFVAPTMRLEIDSIVGLSEPAATVTG